MGHSNGLPKYLTSPAHTTTHMASQETIHPLHWHYDEFDGKNFELQGHSLYLLLIVLAILLLLTFLCLYARCFCRQRHSSLVDAQRASSVRTTLELDPEDIISSIPVHLHRASAGDEEQCSICLGNLVGGEKVKVLPECGHWFHPECVDEWLRTRSSCPLCRASVGGLADVHPDPVAAVV